MASLLQQLENNEAVLLMFLADELPPDDRADVEQQLGIDANLCAHLERLRGVDTAVGAEVQSDLEAGQLGIREAAMVRDAGRMIRRWQAERAVETARSAATGAGMASRSRWWGYPLAAAAVAAVVIIAFWGGPGEIPTMQADPVSAELIVRHLQNIEEETLTARAEPLERLDEAEQQMAALDALTDAATDTRMISWPDAGEHN